MIRKLAAIFCLVLFTTAFSAALGCAAHKTVETTQTTTTEANPAYPDDPRAQPTIVENNTTTTTDKTETEHHGIFNILGEIIALPFRAVGALFTAIF